MTRLLIAAVLLIVAVQAAAFTLPDRTALLGTAGVLAGLTLLAVRWCAVREPADQIDDSISRDPAELLRRWVARTDTLVSWADASRADWDKHLRPVLARQFELATGQRKTKNADSFRVTARMVFGDELWVWVDPDGAANSGGDAPGPGRAVLDELLRRLERI